MARWRWTALVLLLAIVGVPLVMPFFELLAAPRSFFGAYQDRLLFLAGNTLVLVSGTLILALPCGTAIAVLLFRTDLPCRGGFRFFTVMTLFVPLAILTTAWQTALGRVGVATAEGRVWAEGMLPAIWIHAQAALPWVILIVGMGLRSVEPELEEDALMATGPWRVLWWVTLPRCRGAIVASAIWVALQASSEIAVTDLMRIDTFAREVYNEFTLGDNNALARVLAVSLPVVIIGGGAIYRCMSRLDRLFPPLAAALAEPRPLSLGQARWPCFVSALAALALFAGVPLVSLIWRTGLVGYPPEWSWQATSRQVSKTFLGESELLRNSIATMFLSAALIATVALILCWLALDAPRFRRLLFALMAVAWVMPGPILGLGLKETINELVVHIHFAPLSVALYDGPSPLPVLWAHLLHFLPCAVIALWPAVRLLPRELRDSLRIDGASPLQEFRLLVWPLLWRTWLAVVVVIAALAIGEIGAVAMRVETPGWEMFAHVLFNRMHYGQPPDVTALCLVLLLTLGGVGSAVFILARFSASLSRPRNTV